MTQNYPPRVSSFQPGSWRKRMVNPILFCLFTGSPTKLMVLRVDKKSFILSRGKGTVCIQQMWKRRTFSAKECDNDKDQYISKEHIAIFCSAFETTEELIH